MSNIILSTIKKNGDPFVSEKTFIAESILHFMQPVDEGTQITISEFIDTDLQLNIYIVSQTLSEISFLLPPTLAEILNIILQAAAVDKIIILDEHSETISYLGKANPKSSSNQAVWRIQRIDTSDPSKTIILYAEGSSSSNKIWDNRNLYSYS